MPKFDLIKYEEIIGRESFFKLVRDGVCEVNEFESQLEDTVKDEIKTILFRMGLIAQGEILPKGMFRRLTNIHQDAFEIKSNNLRYYGMHRSGTGKIILLCGFKSNQENEYLKKKFAPRIKEYNKHLEDSKNKEKKDGKGRASKK